MFRRLADRVRGAGFGLRLFLGFLLVVILTLGVGATVFAGLLGGYRESVDRQELRSVATAIAVDISRGVERGLPSDELAERIRAHAEDTETTVLLLNAVGRVLEGFDAGGNVRGRVFPVTWKEIVENGERDGWYRSELGIGEHRQDVMSRVLAVYTDRRGKEQAVLLAVTFAEDRVSAADADLVARLLLSALAGIMAASLLAIVLSRSLMRSLRDLMGVVAQFGPGGYEARATERGPRQVRELAAAFNRMAQRVADNERAMRGFIADISHELRTPLTSIRGFAGALQEGAVAEPERQQHALGVIQQETRRMLRMVEQMLDLSRLESGQERLELSDVAPAELLHHVEELFEPRAEDKGLRLRSVVAPDAPALHADHDRLVQVLSNLVDNALRHTEAGLIELRARRDTDRLLLEVEDTGEGIAAERLPHLFDRFYQSPDRSGPGAGLGLAISREIVRAHGGEISAASRLGEGATIRIRLPIAGPAA